MTRRWVAALALLASPATACTLAPELSRLERDCRGGRAAAEVCAWSRAVTGLIADQPDAHTHLARAFALPEEVARKVLFLGKLAAMELVDHDCHRELVARFSRQSIGKLEENLVTFYPVLVTEPRLAGLTRGRDKDTVGVELAAPLTAAGAGLRSFLGQCGRASSIDRWLRLNAAAFDELDDPQLSEHGKPPEREELSRLGNLLDRFGQGDAAAARRELQELLRERTAPFGVRAGYALYRRGHFEDADLTLRQARENLQAWSNAPIGRYLIVMVDWIRVRVLGELGRLQERDRLERRLAEIGDPVERALLDALSRDPDNEKPGPAAAIAVAEIAARAGTADALITAYRTLFPERRSGATLRPLDDTLPVKLARVLTSLEEHRLGDAERHLADLPAKTSWRANLQLRLALAYLAQGRDVDARRVAERLVDQLEADHLQRFRLEDTASSEVDSEMFGAYAFAVDLASWTAPAEESFAWAERGHAFALRRGLGHLAADERSADASPLERALEERISRLERTQGDRQELAAGYRRFDEARRDRRLRALTPADRAPAPIPPFQLAELQQSLDDDEVLLSFYLVGGEPAAPPKSKVAWQDGFRHARLWTWRVGPGLIDPRPRPLPIQDWPRLACWIQALRWQEAGDREQTTARGRGVEVLQTCAGLGPDQDPAVLLYDRLIRPQQHAFSSARRLLIVPHKFLHTLPFGALRRSETGRRLIDDYELAILPSAGTLKDLRARRNTP